MALSVTNVGGSSLFGLVPGQTYSNPIWNASYGGGGGGGGSVFAGGSKPNLAGFDFANALVQILQAGPQASQEELNASLGDLSARESQERKSLSDYFSGMGRPLSSSEFKTQEQQLVDSFSRARTAARATASKTGLTQYQARINPLLDLLKMAQSGLQMGGPSYLSGGGGIHA